MTKTPNPEIEALQKPTQPLKKIFVWGPMAACLTILEMAGQGAPFETLYHFLGQGIG